MASTKLGKRLKDFRLARIWTQRQLAAAIGIHLITVVRIENGKGVTDLTKAKIEQFLGSQETKVA